MWLEAYRRSYLYLNCNREALQLEQTRKNNFTYPPATPRSINTQYAYILVAHCDHTSKDYTTVVTSDASCAVLMPLAMFCFRTKSIVKGIVCRIVRENLTESSLKNEKKVCIYNWE